MGLLALLLPALLPVAADGVRGLVGMFTKGKGAEPQNVDEAIKLMSAQTEQVKALAEIDKPSENISQWVANLRASSRYIAVFLIFGATLVAVSTNAPQTDALLQLSGSAFFFLFGDRVYIHLKNGGSK